MTEKNKAWWFNFFLILVLTSILKVLGLQHYKNVSEKEDEDILLLFILNMFYKDINYIVTVSSSKLVLHWR